MYWLVLFQYTDNRACHRAFRWFCKSLLKHLIDLLIDFTSKNLGYPISFELLDLNSGVPLISWVASSHNPGLSEKHSENWSNIFNSSVRCALSRYVLHAVSIFWFSKRNSLYMPVDPNGTSPNLSSSFLSYQLDVCGQSTCKSYSRVSAAVNHLPCQRRSCKARGPAWSCRGHATWNISYLRNWAPGRAPSPPRWSACPSYAYCSTWRISPDRP